MGINSIFIYFQLKNDTLFVTSPLNEQIFKDALTALNEAVRKNQEEFKTLHEMDEKEEAKSNDKLKKLQHEIDHMRERISNLENCLHPASSQDPSEEEKDQRKYEKMKKGKIQFYFCFIKQSN